MTDHLSAEDLAAIRERTRRFATTMPDTAPADRAALLAEVERLRAAVQRVEALAGGLIQRGDHGRDDDDYSTGLSDGLRDAGNEIRAALAGDINSGDQPAACGAPIGAGTYGCPSVYGPPPTCVLPTGHDGLHMRDVSDPSGDRTVAAEPQPGPEKGERPWDPPRHEFRAATALSDLCVGCGQLRHHPAHDPQPEPFDMAPAEIDGRT